MFRNSDLLTVFIPGSLQYQILAAVRERETERERVPLNECQSCFRVSSNLISVHQEVSRRAGKTTIPPLPPCRCQNRGQLLGRISVMCISCTSSGRPSLLRLDVWSLAGRSVIRVYCDCCESIEEIGGRLGDARRS